MALMDTVKQLMKGRSEVVERGIDTAVGHLGRYSEQLKRQAEAVKAQARTLDAEREEPGSAVAPVVEPPSGAAPGEPPTTPAPPAPPVAPEGPSLRGDLVDDDEPPAGAAPI